MANTSQSRSFSDWHPVEPVNPKDKPQTLHHKLDMLKEVLRRAEKHLDEHPDQWTAKDLQKLQTYCTMGLDYIAAIMDRLPRESMIATLRKDRVYVEQLQEKTTGHQNLLNAHSSAHSPSSTVPHSKRRRSVDAEDPEHAKRTKVRTADASHNMVQRHDSEEHTPSRSRSRNRLPTNPGLGRAESPARVKAAHPTQSTVDMEGQRLKLKKDIDLSKAMIAATRTKRSLPADRAQTVVESSKKLVELDLALVKNCLESREAKEKVLVELIEEVSVVGAETEKLVELCHLRGSAHHRSLARRQEKLADLLGERSKLTCDVDRRLKINLEIETICAQLQHWQVDPQLGLLAALEEEVIDKVLGDRVHHLDSVIEENAKIIGKTQNEISDLEKKFKSNFALSEKIYKDHLQKPSENLIKQYDGIERKNSGILDNRRKKRIQLERLQELGNKLKTRLESWKAKKVEYEADKQKKEGAT